MSIGPRVITAFLVQGGLTSSYVVDLWLVRPMGTR